MRREQEAMGLTVGMESIPSEDNMAEAKSQTVPHLDVAASASRTWSSDDLRNMGAPLSGPSGRPSFQHLDESCPHIVTGNVLIL